MNPLSERNLIARLSHAANIASMAVTCGGSINATAEVHSVMTHLEQGGYGSVEVVESLANLVEQLALLVEQLRHEQPSVRKAKAHPALSQRCKEEILASHGVLVVPATAEVILCYTKPETEQGLQYIAIKRKG
jgi:hypothetical protein